MRIKCNCCVLFVALLLAIPCLSHATPFDVTYTLSGNFRIYGYPPSPQVGGFDYYFTPVLLDANLKGAGLNITSVSASVTGTSKGSVVNFDTEIYLGGTSFGLPEGQFTQTHVDPVSGYSKSASTIFQYILGGNLTAGQSAVFSGSYNFLDSSSSFSPSLNGIKLAQTTEFDVANGLYAQMFFWTADNRNCDISFGDVTLTVKGDIRDPVAPVPEPSTMLLLGSGLAGLVGYGRRRINTNINVGGG